MPKIEALQKIKKLVGFLEKYAEANPAFAQALAEELGEVPKPAAAKKPAARKATPKAQNPYTLLEELGENGFTAHLAALDHETAVSFAKFLGIRSKRKPEELEALKLKIRAEMDKSLGQGQAFSQAAK